VDNALLSFFQQDKDLITDNRPLRLRLAHPTQMLEDVLLPQVVQGTEAICGSVEYRIMCVSLDAFIPLKELIALPVAIDIVTDRGGLRSICGIVTEARAGDSDGGLASYQLVLRDALSIMEKRTNTRVFRNKNEVEIVTLILDEWMQTNPIIGTCFHYEMDELFAHQVYPQREFTMQYNESDAAFIRRLLRRRGIAWYFRADGTDYPTHTMVLFNHPDSLQPSAAGSIRYHRDNATEQRDTITSWSAVRTLQPGRVSRFSWDYRNPKNPSFMNTRAESGIDQGQNGNEMSASLDDYRMLEPHAGDDYDDLCSLGQLAVSRHDYESKCFHGRGSVRDLHVGEYFVFEGHPECDTHSDAEREFVVTSLQIAVSSNLPKPLAERMHRLFWRCDWVQSSLRHEQESTRTNVSFTAVRRGIDIVPTYESNSDIPYATTQSAIVVGPEGEEVHCDQLGRIKIRFKSTRKSDHEHAQMAGAADADIDSAWVRVSSSWAGNGPGASYQCGGLYLPRVGSEVLVTFLDGNPDKPVIVGQLFNGQAIPPGLSRNGELPGNRYLSGIKSREVRKGRSNQLRFDDTEGEISAQLASEHGTTQLNLGFLTQDRESGEAQSRGEGAELRTDLKASIRGSEGVLITSEDAGQEGSMLQRDGLVELLNGARRIAEQLTKLAKQYADDADACSALESIGHAIDQWDKQSTPVVAMNGKEGVAIVSGGPVLIGGATEVDVSSSQTTRFSSAGVTYLRAAQGVRVFANRGGAKVVAAVGKVEVKSNLDAIELVAKKVVELISTSDWINLKAKQGIRLHGGGSELVLSADGIIGYTSGKNVMHAADHQTMKGKSMKADFPGASGCEKQASSAAQSGKASFSLTGS
jgi:type VI secretion system secreted protein VgrG